MHYAVVLLKTSVATGKEEKLRLNLERVEYWQSNGAQLSDRVAKLVKDKKAEVVAA